jgi:hypothetical protein
MKNEISPSLRKLQASYRRSAPKRVYRGANTMMTKMKQRTPVATGTLRDSGQVDEPVWQGDTLYETLGFGGAAEDYAVHVHENLRARHAHGQAKFMESVLKEDGDKFIDEVVAGITQDLGL